MGGGSKGESGVFYFFVSFKKNKITVFLCADDNGPIERKTLHVQEKTEAGRRNVHVCIETVDSNGLSEVGLREEDRPYVHRRLWEILFTCLLFSKRRSCNFEER